MNAITDRRPSGGVRGPSGGLQCPSCAAGLAADANRCPSCGFTGADVMALFPENPPPLLPVLDAAGLWNEADVRRIEAAREKLRRRFPQFRIHVCSVMLPPDLKLTLFGFWLLNVCPFYIHETAEDRAWTVLLLIDARSGAIAAVPGYSAERWLNEESWKKVIWSMAPAWKGGDPTAAVIRFFDSAALHLNLAWKTRGLRRRSKRPSP